MSKKLLATISLLLSPTCFAFSQMVHTPDSEAYFLSLCAQELAEVSERGSWVEKVTKEPVHEEGYEKYEFAGYQNLTYIWHVVKMNGIEEIKNLGRVVYQREYVDNLQDSIPFRHTCTALPSEEAWSPSFNKPKTTPVAEPKIITFDANNIPLKVSKGETLKFKITGKQIWDIGGRSLVVQTKGHKRKFELYVGYGSEPTIGDNRNLCKLNKLANVKRCVTDLDRYSAKDLYIWVHAKKGFSGAHLKTFIRR